MIVYTYACQSCKHTFDALVASDREQPVCPMCQSKKTLFNPVCRPSIRTTNKRRRGSFDMSSGLCPCGCSNKRARAGAAAM
jgi:putative FmdB family regulatory protein